MRRFGLIGKDISHSFSPEYFHKKFNVENINARYDLYDFDDIAVINDIKYSLDGFNVTTPYKQDIIAYLDDLDELSKSIGAVNTVKKVGDRLIGYNTDIFGFEKSLRSFLKTSLPAKALVLGSGGASLAVRYILSDLNISHAIVSRSVGDFRYEDLDESVISEYQLIIQTTPVGTYPDVDKTLDFPFAYLSENHFVIDLIYNPEKSLFLAKAEQENARIKNGLDMLIFQAEKAWEIWNQH